MNEPVTLESLAGQLQALFDEMREIHIILAAMRSEIDGNFHMMRGTDDRIEGLRHILVAHGQRITALEQRGESQ